MMQQSHMDSMSFTKSNHSNQKYVITKKSDMLAPRWLSERINYKTIKFLYRIIDGAETLKGVKIDDEIARIGDTVVFDGNRITVERR